MPLAGGVRQRIADDSSKRATAKSKQGAKPSAFLHKLWKKGKISTADLQEGASTTAAIDRNCADWAKIGASGARASHCQRDFITLLGKKSNLPDLYVANAPMWDHRLKKPIQGKLYFLLPFEILANTISDSNLQSFAAIPDGQEGLLRTLEGWCQRTHSAPDGKTLALGIWGDSAPFHTRDSLFLMLWNILSGGHHKRYWFTTFTKRSSCNCGCMGRHTFEVVWEVMRWSLESLQARMFVTDNMEGVSYQILTAQKSNIK